MEKDTITAISTPRGNGAISIVRMSGRDAFSIVSDVFDPKEKFEKSQSRKAIHGYITDGENKIDEVLLLKYCAPRSFTGEDMIEINCHGGAYITTRILEFIIDNGARLAEPGESHLPQGTGRHGTAAAPPAREPCGHTQGQGVNTHKRLIAQG